MPKLKFDGGRNTQVVSFKVDPITNRKLTALRNLYSKETKRKVTTGEIVKQLFITLTILSLWTWRIK